MTAHSDAIDQTALKWLIRVQEPSFDRWDDWEAWLTGAPEHAAAYWRLAETDAELVAPPLPAQAVRRTRGRPGPAAPRPVTRRLWVGGGIAAALAVACGVAWVSLKPVPPAFETAPGEVRTLVLADGSTAHLAGGSRLTPTSDAREVRLERGRASFEVVHDADRPFTVLVDDSRVVDLGTVFDVTRLEHGVRVAVSEGIVRFDGPDGSERLEVGDELTVINGRADRTRIDPADATAWLEGRLSYRQTSLAIVADDLARAIGVPILVSPALRERSFTGSLETTGTRDAVRARIELLLNVSVEDSAGGWRLGAARTR